MYWHKDELLQALQTGDPKIKNFFDTFGFVVIKKYVNKSDFKRLLKEYKNQYRQRLRTEKQSVMKLLLNRLGFSGKKYASFRQILNVMMGYDTMKFLPNFVDSSSEFMQYFFNQQNMAVYKYFAGEDFLYLGSDGSHFFTTSFPWHRDWFTKLPIMKFNYYFNPIPFFGGKFKVIPGTNFPGDAYTQFLQKSMAWPNQNAVPGGLSENTFLPQSINPRNSLVKAFLSKLANKLGFKRGLPEIPHVALKLAKGDIVIFDQRLIHCVESNFPAFSRRLLTVLISKNAYNFSDDHYLIKSGNQRKDLMTEVVNLVVSERNHIKCTAYGDAIYQHDFSKSKHFIEIKKQFMQSDADNLVYNTSEFTLPSGEKFTSVLDTKKYQAIGLSHRKIASKGKDDLQAEAYSYEDTHLGINAQNIKQISNT